jgi:alpha-D-xyloside xylohydrolase
MPIARPLWLAVPGDQRAADQDQEWMLGRDVLVAPVVVEHARGRGVYFPRGCWREPESGRVVTGPGSERVAAPLGRLPYFFRCGTTPF